MPWANTPDAAFAQSEILPDAKKYQDDDGPRAGLWTILEMARLSPPGLSQRATPPGKDDHRDVRNFDCERFPEGAMRNGRCVSRWKDRSKLKPDALLDNPGAAWSALYQIVNWQLNAVRQTRAWTAWASGGWQVGRDCNKDSLNGKEEAILSVSSTESETKELNNAAGIPNLFKTGELLGAGRATGKAKSSEKHAFGGKIGELAKPEAIIQNAIMSITDDLAEDLVRNIGK